MSLNYALIWDQSTDEIDGPTLIEGDMLPWILAYGAAIEAATIEQCKVLVSLYLSEHAPFHSGEEACSAIYDALDAIAKKEGA